MPMPIPVPEIVEPAWRDAPPGREAAAVNELLRALRELLTSRVPPRWVRKADKEKRRPGWFIASIGGAANEGAGRAIA